MKAGRHFDFFGFVIARALPNHCVPPTRFAVVGTRRENPPRLYIRDAAYEE
jgi:hypothetical protein